MQVRLAWFAIPEGPSVSWRSILAVETSQLPEIFYSTYFGHDTETKTRTGGGGGGQMGSKLKSSLELGREHRLRAARRASCPTSRSALEGP